MLFERRRGGRGESRARPDGLRGSCRAGSRLPGVRLGVRLGIGLVIAALTAPALAAGTPRTSDVASSSLAALASGEDARVQEALAAIGANAEHAAQDLTQRLAAVEAIARLLRAGQSDAVADRALATLAALAAPEAEPVLVELANHRRTSARIAAYVALSALQTPTIDGRLAAGLRDSDGAVRGTCARLLGERGAVATVPVLFTALERGVPEAAAAIGKLGDASAAQRLHGLLGRLPIDVMLSGYEPLLRRAEVPVAVKLDCIARLGEVAAVSVKRFLERQLAEQVGKDDPQLLHALRETARRIDERGPETRSAPP